MTALQQALSADAAWSAELARVYGRAAGDARYGARGTATPLLARLKAAKLAADVAWHDENKRRAWHLGTLQP